MRNRISNKACLDLDREDGVAQHLASVARTAARMAAGQAPVSHDLNPGEYKRGFGWQRDPGPKASATFYDSDKKASWLEFGIPGRQTKSGTANPMPAIHLMRRVMRQLPVRFVERR